MWTSKLNDVVKTQIGINEPPIPRSRRTRTRKTKVNILITIVVIFSHLFAVRVSNYLWITAVIDSPYLTGSPSSDLKKSVPQKVTEISS